MLRVFGHYIAYPALFLAGLEVLLFFVISYLLAVVPLGIGASVPEGRANEELIALIAVVNFLAMVSVGLYNRSVFFRLRSSMYREAITFPLIFIVLCVFLYAFGVLAQYNTDPYYGVVMLAIIAFYPASSIARGVFIDVVNLDVFKRRVLVIGVGPLAARIESLVGSAHRGQFTVVGYIRYGDQEHVNRPLEPTIPGDLLERRHALALFVRDHNVDEIVVAIRERRPDPPPCVVPSFRLVRGLQGRPDGAVVPTQRRPDQAFPG